MSSLISFLNVARLTARRRPHGCGKALVTVKILTDRHLNLSVSEIEPQTAPPTSRPVLSLLHPRRGADLASYSRGACWLLFVLYPVQRVRKPCCLQDARVQPLPFPSLWMAVPCTLPQRS